MNAPTQTLEAGSREVAPSVVGAPRGSFWVPTIGDMLFVTLLVAIPLLDARSLLSSDGDTARHIALGERMLQRGALLRSNDFAITRPGEPFLPFEWGTEVVFASLHRLGGLPLVAIVSGLLIALTYALLMGFMRRHGVDPALRLIVALLAVVNGLVHWLARPHLFTFVGTVLLLFLLEPTGRRRVWPFAVLFAAWANLHGGFVFGLVLIGLYLAGSLAEAWLAADRGEWTARARHYAAALLVGAAACLVNPFGPALYGHVIDFLAGQSYIKSHTFEFLSPNFHVPQAKIFMATAFLVLFAMIVDRRRPDVPRLLLVFCVFASALIYRRNVALFAITVLPVAALQLDAFWRALRSRALDRVRDVLRVGETGRTLGGMSLVALIAVLALGANRGSLGGVPLVADEFDREAFPVAAVAAARGAALEGRMFNEFVWGGYLLYAWPEQKVFIDGGTDFYGESIMRAHGEVFDLQPGWRDALERWRIDLVLLRPTRPLAHELARESDWTAWYCDEVGVLFVRSGAESAAPAATPRAEPGCLHPADEVILGEVHVP